MMLMCALVLSSRAQCICVGVAKRKIPHLFKVFARLFNIKLPGRFITVPGPVVDGKRTRVERFVLHIPGATHCKELSGVMYDLSKLAVGRWLLDYMQSEETSCCLMMDGAEAQQLERLGMVLARRIEGKLSLVALDLATPHAKTGEAQAAAFQQSIEECIQLMEEAQLIDGRAAELLRRFMPTCGMTDREAGGRKAVRIALGLDDGDSEPTCAEHALVNILEEGRKAMDGILREVMNITDEQVCLHVCIACMSCSDHHVNARADVQAGVDADKIKAMRTCVGWFSSPVCALIYQV